MLCRVGGVRTREGGGIAQVDDGEMFVLRVERLGLDSIGLVEPTHRALRVSAESVLRQVARECWVMVSVSLGRL